MDQPSSTESSAITLRIKFKSVSLDDFIKRYGVDVSPGGLFIRTKQPIEVGTTLQFEFSLADGSPLLTGTGTVAWVRENDPGRPNNVPGMGLRFDKLVPESQHTHQAILTEKARKEGKALGTTYPATASVVPVAKPALEPETDRAETAKFEVGKAEAVPAPVSLATTRPAPAAVVNPSALPFALPPPTDTPSQGDDDDDEFDGVKTEISNRPFDYYLKVAARQAGEVENAPGKTAEEAVPNKLIDDFNTDGVLPPTKSGPRPSGSFEAAAEAPLSVDSPTAKPLSGERKSSAFASLLELGNSDERAPAANGASSEFLEELSAGAPIEETAPERTEEVAAAPEAVRLAAAEAPAKAAKFAAPERIDLGSPSLADRPPSHAGMTALLSKGSGKKVAIIAVLAAAAAFAAVYMAKARPWESAPVAPKVVAALPKPVSPLPPPMPVPPTAEPSKPAAEEPAKPVLAAEAKVAATEKAEPEQKATDSAEKVAEKANEKTNNEKPAAKAEAEASSKKSRSAKASAAEKSAAAEEEIYRLVFRSSPLSAEVLIDGEYYAHTPCERRILDPTKAHAITVRKQGYESHERLIGPSDNWVKKGSERILTVSVNLKKVSLADIGKSAVSTPEGVAGKALEPLKAEDTKPVPKAEPVSPPEEKPALFKPVPNFDEPAPKKAKE
jgi:uncharacterized protein (TIGR02266 family)